MSVMLLYVKGPGVQQPQTSHDVVMKQVTRQDMCCPSDLCLQQLAALARRNGSRPPMEPLAAVCNGGSPSQAQQTADASSAAAPEAAAAAVPARKLSLAMALKDRHIARRFFILGYAWMVLCMVYYGELAGNWQLQATGSCGSCMLYAWAGSLVS
jgi:hypothetical protein